MKRKILGFVFGIICLFLLGVFTGWRFQEEITGMETRLATFGYLQVAYVADGDTLRIKPLWGKDKSVRLLGIDTPETIKPGSSVECYGPEASKRLKELTEGKRVWLSFDPSQPLFDDRGRLVAYVSTFGYFFNDTQVNLQLVREGFAEEWTYGAAHQHQAQFREAEDAARKELRGRWGMCGLDSKKRNRK